jgi:hypothetical protein
MKEVSTRSTTGNTAGSTTGSTATTTGNFCGHCGEASDGGDGPPSDLNQSSGARLAMEPPRYCGLCRRRMKVQVTPLGWTAECSRHGMFAS